MFPRRASIVDSAWTLLAALFGASVIGAAPVFVEARSALGDVPDSLRILIKRKRRRRRAWSRSRRRRRLRPRAGDRRRGQRGEGQSASAGVLVRGPVPPASRRQSADPTCCSHPELETTSIVRPDGMSRPRGSATSALGRRPEEGRRGHQRSTAARCDLTTTPNVVAFGRGARTSRARCTSRGDRAGAAHDPDQALSARRLAHPRRSSPGNRPLAAQEREHRECVPPGPARRSQRQIARGRASCLQPDDVVVRAADLDVEPSSTSCTWQFEGMIPDRHTRGYTAIHVDEIATPSATGQLRQRTLGDSDSCLPPPHRRRPPVPRCATCSRSCSGGSGRSSASSSSRWRWASPPACAPPRSSWPRREVLIRRSEASSFRSRGRRIPRVSRKR